MKIKSTKFRVAKGDGVRLGKWPTRVKPVYRTKKHYKELLREHVDQLSALQKLFFARIVTRCCLSSGLWMRRRGCA